MGSSSAQIWGENQTGPDPWTLQTMHHKDIQHWGRYCMFLLLIAINSEQTFPKMARPKGAISIFGNLPLDHKVHITLWFPFLDIWPWKSMCEYLNEISTKHCHITTFRKPLTKATQLILIYILGNSDQISQQKYWKILIKWRKFMWSWSWLNHDAKHKQTLDNWKYFLKHECEKFQKSAKMLIKCRKFSWARWYRTHDTKQGNTG